MHWGETHSNVEPRAAGVCAQGLALGNIPQCCRVRGMGLAPWEEPKLVHLCRGLFWVTPVQV